MLQNVVREEHYDGAEDVRRGCLSHQQRHRIKSVGVLLDN